MTDQSTLNQLLTHKLTETMQALSDVTNINWLVLGWNGRAQNGIFFNNPTRLDCKPYQLLILDYLSAVA